MTSPGEKKQLSILTFNTFGTPLFAPDITKRYHYIAREINNGPYDVVCLQELFSYYNFYLFKKRLKKFPYVSYHKNILGPRGGLAIFSKYPLTQQEFLKYSFPGGAAVPFYTKIAQPGLLSCTIKDFSLRIGTTHLSSDLVHKLTPKDKLYKLIKSQSQEAAAQVNRYAEKFDTTLLMGDFNIAKHSELYTSFLAQTQTKDLFANDELKTYYRDRFNYIYTAYNSERIDYMFLKTATNKLKITKTEHVLREPVTFADGKKSYLSDHIGLHCILRVNN